MKCYHMTTLDRLQSINEFGLLPRNERNCKLVNDYKVKVFFSEGFEGAIALFVDFNIVYNKIRFCTKEKFIMNLKNSKGVTLLSLAVTVSVMILLLGTVIIVSLKDDGVIIYEIYGFLVFQDIHHTIFL